VLRIRWITQVCTVASVQQVVIDSGRPFSPSHTTMTTSPGVLARAGAVLLVPQMLGQLRFKHRFQHGLGQPTEQASRADQADPLSGQSADPPFLRHARTNRSAEEDTFSALAECGKVARRT